MNRIESTSVRIGAKLQIENEKSSEVESNNALEEKDLKRV